MQHQSLIAYIFVLIFSMTMVLAETNTEQEKFADLLQRRKHLSGYWVGKRVVILPDGDPLFNSGKNGNEIQMILIY